MNLHSPLWMIHATPKIVSRRVTLYNERHIEKMRGPAPGLKATVTLAFMKRPAYRTGKQHMATWFTSDTHFGHARIIELARRPFSSVREMVEALIRAWNERVQPNDVVWHAGDFSFEQDACRIDEVFARLNGEKHLIVGNHDEGNEATLTLPWASTSVLTAPKIGEEYVALCHYPMKTWPKARKGVIPLHGHMHGRLRGTTRSLDVGVDAWGFIPVSLAEIRHRLRSFAPDPAFIRDIDDDGAPEAFAARR